LYWGLRPLYAGWRSRKWTAIEGEVLHARVRKAQGDRGNDQYDADVEYTYQPEIRPYRSTRIAFSFAGTGFLTQEGAKEFIAPYRAGKKVTVYYDPRDPSSAVLQTGARFSLFMTVFCVITGIPFTAVAIWFLANTLFKGR
jgi:hypothetical protein